MRRVKAKMPAARRKPVRRARAKPLINRAMVDRIVQPE